MPVTTKRQRTLPTMADATSESCAYWGEHEHYLIAAAQHRDSDTIDRSNFIVLQKQLGADAIVERLNHWAVGWIEYLIIAPNSRNAMRIAVAARKAIAEYPLLDESHHSELEYNEFYEYAAGELKSYDMWEDALETAMRENNSGPGDESAEFEIIESAKSILEEREAMLGQSFPINPAQLDLFPHAITDFNWA